LGKKVIILGGGVAGMSAAHELIERGFNVEVFEKEFIPGGKARSLPVNESLVDRGQTGVHGRAIEKWRRMRGHELGTTHWREWLPGEHGFRFFPGFYKHIVDTMERIPYPYGRRRVSDNLVNTTQVLLSRSDGRDFILPSRFPRAHQGVQAVLDAILKLIKGDIGVSGQEVAFFATRVWQVITSSQERRLDEYEKIGWWDFINACNCSQDYQKFFGHGLTRSLVASQAHLASARTIGNIFLQLLLDIADPTVPTTDRLLNGPTNDVWIQPWLNYLEAQGVKYHRDCHVEAINCSGGLVRSVTVKNEGRSMEITGDYYVAALPVERMAPLITWNLKKADPRLGLLPELAKNVEWMAGIQFYLERPVPIIHGHVLYLDSPWALTSVSQGQFWPDFDLSQYSDGDTREILSVCISDWSTPGLNGKIARECKREEIAREVFDQIKFSLNSNNEGPEVLPERFEEIDYWFLSPGIKRDNPEDRLKINVESLLVNLKDTWRLRPEAVTAIPNLFLAADYVRTYTDLATMEAANEAARRAVNGILDVSGSNSTPCQLWKLHEPEIFKPLQEFDKARWQAGLPWKDPLPLTNLLLTLLGVEQKSGKMSSGEVDSLLGIAGSPDSIGGPRQVIGKNGPTETENLLHVTKQVLSRFDNGPMKTVESGKSQNEASKGPVASAPPATPGLTINPKNRPHPRIRIIQNPYKDQN